MSNDQESDIDPEFLAFIEKKNQVLLACGEVGPKDAITLLTLAMTDILVNTANAKEYALNTAETIHEQLCKNIEAFDDHGMAWWNKNIQ